MKVMIDKKATNDAKSLDVTTLAKVYAFFKELEKWPTAGCKKLVGQGKSKNSWRKRIGNYRVLFTFDKIDNSVIRVTRIVHRSKAYR